MRDLQGDQRRRPWFAKRRGSSKLRFPILIRRWALVVVGVRAGEEAAAADVRGIRVRQSHHLVLALPRRS
jgi:hypothetical protein